MVMYFNIAYYFINLIVMKLLFKKNKLLLLKRRDFYRLIDYQVLIIL